ncbi:P-loop containing nucleoside triphosphate hydrolase protein [Haematococcus lacustris]
MGQDRDYYRFMKEGVVFRVEELKAKELRRFQLATRRMEDAKNFKAAQQEQLNLLKDIRNQRNKGIVRLHERLNRDLAKQQEDDRSRRLDALRANDFEAYQELLRQQQGPTSEEEDNRFHAITKFLNETEDYLNKLASKVANIKTAHEAEAYVAAAMEEARRAGASDSDITLAGQRAALEFKHESELLRKEKNMQGDAQTRYYELAHSVQEDIVRPPLYLRPPAGASLREYQMVGLKWMVSLYNNHLNGILADEMGLGKTVQVMALIAYLMEHKKVFGPHLIIVPNAVMVNWKSELQQWLPCVRCVYYVGTKDERHRQYVQEVAPKNFNILVTTYEYIMRDRAKLSKIEWKYIIIDEAQRLKERQSKLSKDLDRFVGGRRLLLTGTPLQNEYLTTRSSLQPGLTRCWSRRAMMTTS